MKALISRKDLRDTNSGVPKKVLQELKSFRSRGYESFAIAETVNHSMIKEFGGIPVKTLRWPFSGFTRRRFYQFQVARWINKNKPDIVIGHGDILHQDVLFMHNCVHLAHELIENKPLPENHEVGRIHKAIFTNGSFKLLICNSRLMKNELSTRFNLEHDKLRVIYPEIYLEKFLFDSPEHAREEWRTKFGFRNDDIVIGCVTSGNFKKRNLSLLINAYIELTKKYPTVRLFIAGGNVDQKYKDQAAGFGVVFAPPIIDVKNYYNLLDIFALPAHIEEFGRSVLEAMFFKKPVVTSRFVGASEILQGYSKELVINEITMAELVGKCSILIESKELRSEIGNDNHKVSLMYSADEQNRKFADALDEFRIIRG